LSRVGKLQVLANSSLLGVLESDGGECLDVEVGSFGAGLDELSGEGEDSAGLESSVESSGDWLGAGCDADESLVTGLDSEDGTSGGKDIGRVDERGGTEVGRDTNSLKNTGSLDHGISARKGSVEVVLARLDGLCTSSCDCGLEGSDVSSLSLSDAHQGLDLAFAQTESHKVAHGELGETLLVVFRFEMLGGQSAVVTVSFGSR
jgi:hypothetical protein